MGKTPKASSVPLDAEEPALGVLPSKRPDLEPASVLDADEIVSDVSSATPEASEQAIEAQSARNQNEAESVPKKRGSYKKKGQPQSVVRMPGEIDPKIMACRAAGRATADTIILLGETLGGADWKPVRVCAPDGAVTIDERETLRGAWADLFEAYKWSAMPPWAAVCLATGAYAIPRLGAPSTLDRWERLKLWWGERQARKAKARANA